MLGEVGRVEEGVMDQRKRFSPILAKDGLICLASPAFLTEMQRISTIFLKSVSANSKALREDLAEVFGQVSDRKHCLLT